MITTRTLTIRLARDHTEGDAFAAWLAANGHNVLIGNDTHNHVDGVDVSSADGAESDECDVFAALWAAYCEAATDPRAAEDCLKVAHTLLLGVRADRAQAAALRADDAADAPYWVDVFGARDGRLVHIEADIVDKLGRLSACRDDLMAMGLTQADCKALWARMQAA
jgi:hypothetical protein